MIRDTFYVFKKNFINKNFKKIGTKNFFFQEITLNKFVLFCYGLIKVVFVFREEKI